MDQVFIEDYVISFLKQMQKKAAEESIRLALFGYQEKNEEGIRFSVYGASCEAERTVEEINQEFFAGYSFIGFVTIYRGEKESFNENSVCIEQKNVAGQDIPEEKERPYQYHIFFDQNEAMQDYLLFYHGQKEMHTAEAVPVQTKRSRQPNGLWTKLKILLLGFVCVVLAIAISIIDDYSKMRDFVKAMDRTIEFIEETG